MPFAKKYTEGTELAISLTLFYIALTFNSIGQFYNSAAYLLAAFSILIIAYAILYGLSRIGKNTKRYLSISYYLSIALFVVYLIMVLLNIGVTIPSYGSLELVTTLFMLFIFLFFILQLFLYTKNIKYRNVLFAVIVITIVLYFSVMLKYSADDETVIAYYAVTHLLQGHNPYSYSIGSIIYNASVGMTLTSNNTIAGSVGYPALYFLVNIPFYTLAHNSIAMLSGAYMHTEAVVFFTIFIIAFCMIKRKRSELFEPKFLIYIALAFVSLLLTSITVYLMIALVLFLYTDAGKRYSWIILGLAISIQEQLWPISILFLAYSMNTYGLKKGLKDIAGTAVVFLLINGVFIAAGPSQYFTSVLSPLSAPLPLSNSAAIGYLLISNYHILLSTTSVIAMMVMLLSLGISLYINDRKMIPLISIFPFMFIVHALTIHLLLPIFVFIVLLDMVGEKKMKGYFRSAIESNKNALYAATAGTAIIIAAMFAIIIASHAQYQKQFNVSISNQSLSYAGNNDMLYNARISYTGPANNSVYLIIQSAYYVNDTFFGLFNESIINGSQKCTAYPCILNLNKIILSNTTDYSLTARFRTNYTGQTYASAMLYNQNHFYKAQPVVYK